MLLNCKTAHGARRLRIPSAFVSVPRNTTYCSEGELLCPNFAMTKIVFNIFVIYLVVAVAYMGMAAACINNGDSCQPNASLGNCCSGNCYKELGWGVGYCA